MGHDVYVPPTAARVHVANVTDPYRIYLRNVEDYAAKIGQLGEKLHHVAKTDLVKYKNGSELRAGDLVLVDRGSSFDADLPAWYCRGVAGRRRSADSKYRVFLPDHGVALNLGIEEMKILPPTSISDDYLTSCVGLNDVLPIALANGFVSVSDRWSKDAIRFTREVVGAAETVYFDHLASDENGNKYGELHLILDGDVIVLSEALVCNGLARRLTPDLTKIIGHPDDLLALCGSTETAEDARDDRKKTKEDTEYSDKFNAVQRCEKSTAVYARAFNKSLKRHYLADSDHEILIAGKVLCKRLDSVKEAAFPRRIHKVLGSLSITRPMRLQGYVWPAIIKGSNVVVIASQKTGKTLSYLVPIVGMVAENETRKKPQSSTGPLALILCESSMDVFTVDEFCKELLRNYSKVNVVSAYNGIQELDVMVRVYNGCEILISTPEYLKRLIKNKKYRLNFCQLSHVVFDGVDVMFEKYRDSLREIIKILKPIRSERQKRPVTNAPQTIAIARYWTPSLRRFVDCFVEDPYVCIASYMEAAVYAALRPKLIFLPKNRKATKVAELLDGQWRTIKTMVICTSTREVVELDEVLKSNFIDTVVVHDEMIFTAVQGAKETWMSRVSGNYLVVVCTDRVLPDLKVGDVERLIHYSIGTDTKTQFFYRFSTLTDSFSCRNRYGEKKSPEPKCVLIADESNDTQLNGVIAAMRRLEVKIPTTMEADLEKIFTSVEMAKTDRLLCDNVKAFGRCKKDSCASRHCVVPDIDKPATDIRTGDGVKLKLTGIHSPSYYSARVTEYTRAGTGEWISFSFPEFTHIAIGIQEHYGSPGNRRSAKALNAGTVCAIEVAPGNYKRVQVLSAVDQDSLRVRDAGDGDVFLVKACQLLELPEELAQWPSHILDIYLTGIVPVDCEPTWSPSAYEIVSTWFEENDASTSYVYGKVLLHLGHTLWVDTLEIHHKLHGYPDLVDSTLKAKLIDANCAVENKDRVTDLLQHGRMRSD